MEWLAYRPYWAVSVRARLSQRSVRGCLFLSIPLIALATAGPADAQTPPLQVNQTFNSQGPSPATGNFNFLASADASPNGTVAGAVTSVLADPALGAGTMFAATPNGGIWLTTNSGSSWKALTDNLASLSIGSLSLDPTDATGKTIIAGIGIIDNGGYSPGFTLRGRGGQRDGLLYTTDGGTTWSVIGKSVLAGESVVDAMARGNTILAATFETQNASQSTSGYGLFRSTDGGGTFNNISGTGVGLPNGAVTSLVADPRDPTTFYAAVTNSSNNGSTAVYVSHNTGASWSKVFGSANTNLISAGGDQTVITLAAGPNGSVAIALSDLGNNSRTAALAGVFLSGNQGTSWNQVNGAPNVVPGGQTPVNLHIAIDPTNQNILYLSGDRYDTCPCSVQLYRLNYNPANNTSTPTSLTFEGSAANNLQDANTVHADSRSITFDQAGDLILTSDGGIYKRTNPQGAGVWEGGTGTFKGLNGNLGVFEIYSIAYDANSKRLGVAAQDTGAFLQTAPGSGTFTVLNSGDGTNIAINDRSLPGQSVIYTTAAGMEGLSRLIIDSQGRPVSPGYDPANAAGGIAVTCSTATLSRQDCGTINDANDINGQGFSAQFVLNKIDPTLIAMTGISDVFTARDSLSGTGQGIGATSMNLFLTDLGNTNGAPSVVTYGTVNDTKAIAVGSFGDNGSIWFSPNNSANSLIELTSNLGTAPTGIVFDTRIQSRIFAVDGTDLIYTRNAGAGATFATLTASFPLGFIRPTSVEFISNNGVNALLVGGLDRPLTCTSAPNGCTISSSQSPIIAADSDSSGLLSNWRYFGQGLPNTFVYAMAYNPTVDVLAVSSIGRGAFVLYDVTSYFPQATRLQFGLANNDSMPDVSYLNDGTVGSRALVKYGTGTLTIAGDAIYTGGTTINAGTLVLGIGGASGSVIGNITFCSNGSDPSCDTSTAKVLAFNRSDVSTYAGSITGPGQVLQVGSGTIVLSGVSSYSGPTTVANGTLQAGGANVFSPNSSYAVAGGASLDLHGFDQLIGGLSGAGPVTNSAGALPTLTIAGGGVFAPGNSAPGSSMAVASNLAFQSAAFYSVQIKSTRTTYATVLGVATLAGATVQASFDFSSGSVSRKYTILSAAGGINGVFGSLITANLPATLTPNLSYDGGNALLNLALNYSASGPLNSNQQNVGNALANFFDRNGSIPAGFIGLTPAGLSQVSGETATGAQQTTFQAMNQFLSTLLDPFIGGREGAETPIQATPYAEQGDAAGRSKLTDDVRAAYAAVFTKAPLRQIYDPHWSVWTSAFGGSQTTDGDAARGSNNAASRVFGIAAGADYLLSPRTIAGFALAGGGTSFSVANSGTGRSDLFQAGGYVRHSAGAAYVSAALAYGWQDVITDRQVMADRLHAEFNANALSGRVEGGYRIATRWVGITPYAAGQFTTFFLPAYAESVVLGTNAFALAYGSRNVTDTRSELGVRADRSFALATGLLTLRGRLAWAHDFNPDRSAAATFQALPGASFVVGGATQASESALTTASAEMKWRNGWSAVATFEGEFSKVTASYAGKGLVRYAW